MFQVSLDQMEKRQTELLEFSEKLNRLSIRLEEQIRALERMESFSEIAAWLTQTEENLEVQTGQAKEMGAALESAIRFYRSSENRILEHLENGPVRRDDEVLAFTAPDSPGIWSELMEL